MFEKYKKIKPKRKLNNEEISKDTKNKGLDKLLDNNIALFKIIFKNDETLIIREFENKNLKTAKCCIFYIDGMVNPKIINDSIIEPILNNNLSENIRNDNLLEELKRKVIGSDNVTLETQIDKMVSSVVYGDTLFLLDRYEQALIISSKGWQTRSVTEPDSSKVIRGPREGFTESIMINLSLVRRKIKNT